MVRWLIRPIFLAQLRHIKFLQRELVTLRVTMAERESSLWAEIRHERQRAEMAIDHCRNSHQNIGPVTMPPMPTEPQSRQLERDLAALTSSADYQAMGSSIG